MTLIFNHLNNQYLEGMFWGLWWAQDGTPAHRLLEVRDRLNETFGENRVVSLGHNVEIFYVGLLKDKVFSRPSLNIQLLRQQIIDEFNGGNLILFEERCVTCTDGQFFVSKETVGMLKGIARSFMHLFLMVFKMNAYKYCK